MAEFVQGRHQLQRVGVAGVMIVRGQGGSSSGSEVTATSPAVSRVCGPAGPGYTCALGH